MVLSIRWLHGWQRRDRQGIMTLTWTAGALILWSFLQLSCARFACLWSIFVKPVLAAPPNDESSLCGDR